MRVAASVTRFGRIRTAQASAIPAPTAVATVPPSTHHQQSAHEAAPGASDIDVVRLVRNVGLVAVSQAAASATYGRYMLTSAQRRDVRGCGARPWRGRTHVSMTANANDCKSPSTATNYADACLREYDNRFKPR